MLFTSWCAMSLTFTKNFVSAASWSGTHDFVARVGGCGWRLLSDRFMSYWFLTDWFLSNWLLSGDRFRSLSGDRFRSLSRARLRSLSGDRLRSFCWRWFRWNVRNRRRWRFTSCCRCCCCRCWWRDVSQTWWWNVLIWWLRKSYGIKNSFKNSPKLCLSYFVVADGVFELTPISQQSPNLPKRSLMQLLEQNTSWF